MTHYFSLNNGKEIAVDINCNHPELENNTCPTGTGDCANCEFCNATMSARDFFALKENGFMKARQSK